MGNLKTVADTMAENPVWREKKLLVACKYGNEDIALNLLDNVEGIDLKAHDSYGHDSCDWALANGLETVVEALESLLDKNAAWRKNALLEACRAEDEDFALKLLSIDGVDLNATDSDGRTPFYIACWKNLPKVVQAMVDEPKGIDF